MSRSSFTSPTAYGVLSHRWTALLTLILVILPLAVPAQAHQVEQVILAGGSRNDAGNGLAIDAVGNRYLVGAFQDTTTFGLGGSASQLRSRGVDDAFVAKYDATGNLAWARQVGGQLVDIGRGVALGANDTLYVAGLFSTSVSFGNGVTLNSQGQGDGFLARYNRDGTAQWAARIAGPTGDAAFAVASIGADVIVVGFFSGTATLSQANGATGAILTSAGASDIFIARYNAAGGLLWARQAGGSGNDVPRAVATDSSGELYVTGGFSTTATFGSPGVSRQLASVGLDDLFVARYGPDGELRWATQAGGAKADRGLGIALDQTGQSYVTGFFIEKAQFGERALTGVGSEIVLVQLDRDGHVVRAVSAGGAGIDEGRGIAVAPNGTIYLTGRYQDIALFGEGGNLRELRQRDRSSPTNISLFTVAYDASFKPVFLEGAGFEDDSREQSGNAVAADAASRAHVTGTVQGRTNFGVGSTFHSERTAGQGDTFLVTYATGTPREVFYLSSSSGGTVDGIGFADEDVLAYDPANNRWSVLIDGSDIGLEATDIDGFEWRPDGTQLLSMDSPVTLPGIPFLVDDSDIVRFVPTRLGATTEGRFEFFFDGSDVGLDGDSEDIDAIGVRADGKLVISTEGTASVPGARSGLTALDADLLLFSGDQLGEATRGSWERLFEGASSQLGDQPGEGLRALWFPPDDAFVFGTGGLFTETRLTGDGAELFRCTLFDLGEGLLCSAGAFFDGAAKGTRGESIDAFSVGESGVLGEIGDGDDTEAGPPEDPAEIPGTGSNVFLPLVWQ